MYEQEKVELLGQKVSLARDMLSDKILPYEWIYNNVFNFSDKEKVEIENQIIDDQKQKFRHSQIEMEGNDPMASESQSEHQVIWQPWVSDKTMLKHHRIP